MENKIFGFYENGSRDEVVLSKEYEKFKTNTTNSIDNVYTKEEIEEKFNQKITFGTANPSGGNDGDIYIKYS